MPFVVVKTCLQSSSKRIKVSVHWLTLPVRSSLLKMAFYSLLLVMVCCLLLCYPVLGAPATKEDNVAANQDDVRQSEKLSSEIATGCDLYLSSINSLVNSSSTPNRNCFVPSRPCQSNEDVFQLISQDLNSSQSLYHYTTQVIKVHCNQLTPSNLLRCTYLTANILQPLNNLMPVLQDLLPTNKQESKFRRADMDSPDSSRYGSGQEPEDLLNNDAEDSCSSLDYDQQKANYEQLKGLTVLIKCDVQRLADDTNN